MRVNKRSLLCAAVMVLLLAWTAHTILKGQTPGELGQAILSADWRFLLLGAGAMALFIAFEAKASHSILRALGSPQPFRRCCLYSCAGFFFSNITPSATGGQPAQVYYMSRDGVSVANGTIDMLLVTIGYHTAILTYGVLALLTCGHLTEQLGGQVGFLLGMGFTVFVALNIAMILFLFLPNPARRLCLLGLNLAARVRPCLDRKKLEERLDGYIGGYRRGAAVIRKTPGLLPKIFLCSLGQLGCTYLVPYLVYLSFGLGDASLWQVFSLQVLCAISVGYLPLPGAAGAAENVFLRGFQAVFGLALVAPAMILSRAVSCYLVLAVTGVITAVFHVRGRRARTGQPAPARERKAA